MKSTRIIAAEVNKPPQLPATPNPIVTSSLPSCKVLYVFVPIMDWAKSKIVRN